MKKTLLQFNSPLGSWNIPLGCCMSHNWRGFPCCTLRDWRNLGNGSWMASKLCQPLVLGRIVFIHFYLYFHFFWLKIENARTVRVFLLVFSLPPPSRKNSQLVKKRNASDWFISYYVILVLSKLIVDMVLDFCFKQHSNRMKIGWIIKNFIRNH